MLRGQRLAGSAAVARKMRLALKADSKPIRSELWCSLTGAAHGLQDHTATDVGAFIARRCDWCVSCHGGPDLRAHSGERHLIAVRAESLLIAVRAESLTIAVGAESLP